MKIKMYMALKMNKTPKISKNDIYKNKEILNDPHN